MSPDDPELPTSSTVDKGKRRAQNPTERTPLLHDSPFGTSSRVLVATSTPPTSRHRLRAILTTVFLISFSLCVIIAVFITFLAWSYASKASSLSPDRVLNQDLVLSGPFDVHVLNTTDDGGLWVNVSGRVGFDAGDAIGVNHPLSDEGGLLDRLWRAIGRWGIRKLDIVTVDLAGIQITPNYNTSLLLLSAEVSPLQVPLTVDPPRRSLQWLRPMSVEVLVRPTRNATALADFIAESWKRGTIEIGANVKEVTVRGGAGSSWKSRFRGSLKSVQTAIRMKIPPLPGIPQPGKNRPLPSVSDFLTLTSFHISNQHNNLTLYAEATIINPLPENVGLTLPSLPVTISLPNGADSPLPVARVATYPCEFTHPNTTLYVSGTVPVLSKSSFPLLSAFLNRYLSAEANPILISTPLLSDPSNPSAPGLEIPAEFPAPKERPRLLRNVTIKDMKIRPVGTNFLASGTVFAKVVLPKGIDVAVDVFRAFPDVLVFDGEVPDYEDKRIPPRTPDVPDPLPEHAFGHIRPDDWLPATSVRMEDEGGGGDGEEKTGAVYAVSAEVVDVPFEVLPGRKMEFTKFVRKVIFTSEGALAGIKGYAAVTLEVEGLAIDIIGDHRENGGGTGGGAMLELTSLPFRGSVRVGKKGSVKLPF